MTEKNLDVESFDENYRILEAHAVRLRDNGNDVKIDELADIVQESAAAYKRCRARTDALGAVLNSVFASIDEDVARQ